MTDYLGQLVLRGRQPDLAVEPRQASRFERPRQPALALATELPTGPHAATAEPGGASRDVASAPAGGRHQPPRAVAVTVNATPPDHSGESPAAAHSVSTSARAPLRQPPAVLRDSETPRPFDRGPSSPAILHERVPSAPLTPLANMPAPRSQKQIEGDSSSRDAAGLDHERPPARVRVTTEAVARVDRPRPPELLPASTPNARQATPAARDIERAAAGAAPTIHVTIGRVEIRAGAAAPVARKASPRPPTMTLEQYLRQRRGASRE